jgi:hypothetical protein
MKDERQMFNVQGSMFNDPMLSTSHFPLPTAPPNPQIPYPRSTNFTRFNRREAPALQERKMIHDNSLRQRAAPKHQTSEFASAVLPRWCLVHGRAAAKG